MRIRSAVIFLVAALVSIAPASASRHGGFGTAPIGKKVDVTCFNDGGAVYEKKGWLLVSIGTTPENIILAEALNDADNSKTVVITLSGQWDCVIETP